MGVRVGALQLHSLAIQVCVGTSIYQGGHSTLGGDILQNTCSGIGVLYTRMKCPVGHSTMAILGDISHPDTIFLGAVHCVV